MFRWFCHKISQALPERKPGEMPTTVMHVSDLHFGYRFDNILWQDVVRRAKAIKPDIIIVTGDVVNTPWRWSIRRAGRRLVSLRDSLRLETKKAHLQLFAVPGNHDTRILGLYPIQWLLATAGISAGTAYLAQLMMPSGIPVLVRNVVVYGGYSLAFVSFMLRIVTTKKLAGGGRHELFITQAQVLDGFNVGVIPFDSATVGVRWAAGTVKRGALGSFRDVASRYEPAAESMGVFWIAAVHHHPVPLPYDSGNETMMIMTNAGKFLHELASYGVPLVLHGHKHHQHFSKLSFQTPYSTQSEIAVLSASTPTESNGAGAFRHGFNVINVNEEHQANVSVYSAQPTGETFILKKTFCIAESSEMARRRYESYLSRIGVYCQKATFTTTIDEFGGAEFTRRFQGFESQHLPLSGLPCTFRLSCPEGHVGEVTVVPVSDVMPHMVVRESVRNVNEVRFSLDFEGSLLAPGIPVEFSLDVQGSNVFALDVRQYEELYNDDLSTLEHMIWTVPEGMAIKELQLHLKFKSKGVHPAQIRLSRALSSSGVWRPCDEQVSFVPGDSSASVTIRHPQPNGCYRLTWRPPEAPERASALHEGRSRTAREQLAFATDATKAHIGRLLPVFATVVGNRLFDLGQNGKVDAAVFSYVSQSKRLQVVSSTYTGTDARRQWSFGYGRGLVGRAFKLNAAAAFDKLTCAELGYSHYLRGDGKVAECAEDVVEGGAFAFPLCVVDKDGKLVGEPFGILMVSVDGWGGQLTDREEGDDTFLQNMQAFWSQELLAELNRAILSPTNGKKKWKNQRRRISFLELPPPRKRERSSSDKSFTRL